MTTKARGHGRAMAIRDLVRIKKAGLKVDLLEGPEQLCVYKPDGITSWFNWTPSTKAVWFYEDERRLWLEDGVGIATFIDDLLEHELMNSL